MANLRANQIKDFERITPGLILKDRVNNRWGIISTVLHIGTHVRITLPRVAMRSGILEVGQELTVTYVVPATSENFQKFSESVYSYVGDGCCLLFVPANSKKGIEYMERWKRIF